jgi:prevent-host-death family protein
MKRKKRPRSSNYPDSGDTAARIKEDAAKYGLRRDVLGVREAKDQLSSLLKRASLGEEIVITSDGIPAAMIVRYKPVIVGKPFRSNWEELRLTPMTSDSTEKIRAERDSRP